MISFILFSPGPFWQMKCPIKEMVKYTNDIKKENELILKNLLLYSDSNYYNTQMWHQKSKP